MTILGTCFYLCFSVLLLKADATVRNEEGKEEYIDYLLDVVTAKKIQKPFTHLRYSNYVLAKPEAITLQPVRNINSTSILVTWKEPTVFKGQINGYKIIYKAESSSADRTVDVKLNLQATVDRLTPYTYYNFTVRAYRNVRGIAENGEMSETKTVMTLPAAPSEVTNTKIYNITSTSFWLSWSRPRVLNGPIDGFLVDVYGYNRQIEVDRRLSSVKVSDLDPYGRYLVQVNAFNWYPDPSDDPVEVVGPKITLPVRTLASKPGECRYVDPRAISSTSVNVRWNPPPVWNGPINGYVLRYNLSDDVYNETYVKYNENGKVLPGLIPYTVYLFEVLAYNIQIDGTEEVLRGIYSGMTQITQSGSPSEPRNLRQIGNANSTYFKVEWDKPRFSRGPLSGYNISYRILNPIHYDEGKTIYLPETIYNDRVHGFEEMTPFRKYEVAVTAFNYNEWVQRREDFFGPSATLIVETQIGIPKQPEDVKMTLRTSNSLDINWTPAIPQTGPTIYSVKLDEAAPYMVETCDNVDWSDSVKTEQVEGWYQDYFRFSDLKFSHCYRARVVSHTDAGFAVSEFSNTIFNSNK